MSQSAVQKASASPETAREKVAFVLIHGGGMGSWVWERVVPLLALPSLAVDLPGRGSDGDHVNQLLIEGCALRVIEAVERSEFDRIIPVMHSYSGVLAPHIARRLSTQVAHLIFLATTNPPDGRRPLYPRFDRLVMRLQRSGVVLPRFPFRSAMRHAVLTDMDAATVRWALERVTYTEPPALYLDRVSYHGMSDIPRTYIQLTRDQAVPLEVQVTAAQALGARMLAIDTGHAAMLSRPVELANLLNQVASQSITKDRVRPSRGSWASREYRP